MNPANLHSRMQMSMVKLVSELDNVTWRSGIIVALKQRSAFIITDFRCLYSPVSHITDITDVTTRINTINVVFPDGSIIEANANHIHYCYDLSIGNISGIMCINPVGFNPAQVQAINLFQGFPRIGQSIRMYSNHHRGGMLTPGRIISSGEFDLLCTCADTGYSSVYGGPLINEQCELVGMTAAYVSFFSASNSMSVAYQIMHLLEQPYQSIEDTLNYVYSIMQ